jgi:hypothetical protein
MFLISAFVTSMFAEAGDTCAVKIIQPRSKFKSSLGYNFFIRIYQSVVPRAMRC